MIFYISGNDKFEIIILIFIEKYIKKIMVWFLQLTIKKDVFKVCSIWCVGQDDSAAPQHLHYIVFGHTEIYHYEHAYNVL